MRPTTQKKVSFDVQKEKEVFLDALPKFLDKNQASTFVAIVPRRSIVEIPEIFDQLFQKQLTRKVSKLKEFFKSCLSLTQDKDVVAELTTLIEEPQVELRPYIRANRVGKRLKIGHEYDCPYRRLIYGLHYPIPGV